MLYQTEDYDYNDSIYSNIQCDLYKRNTVDEILYLYEYNELLPLPISVQNMRKLKTQWDSHDYINSNGYKKKKENIWNKIKTKLSPKK